MEKEYSYRGLNVYKKAVDFVIEVYKILQCFPREENYALCDQLRRAAVSVPSNLAEGLSRISDREKLRFIDIAYGSLMETYCQMEIAYKLGYIHEDTFKAIDEIIDNEARIINGMRSSLKKSLADTNDKKLTTNTL